jgi:hypothetical protein
VHSKKIGTVLSVGLIHLFFVLMSRSFIKSYATWVNLFFDEADIAAAFHARESNNRNVVRMCAKAHVLVQIVH